MFVFGLLILSVFFFSQCVRSGARGRIVKSGCGKGVAVVDGQLDAGVNVEISVRNEGKSGFIQVKAMLSSSEGSFSRSQEVYFKEKETKDLKFLIHEVTINADNLQCFGDISPEAW